MYTKMFGVEYKTENENSTFEIFKDYKDALKFSKNKNTLYIFSAFFNNEHIYQEENLVWNYDDNSDLYKNFKVIKNESL